MLQTGPPDKQLRNPRPAALEFLQCHRSHVWAADTGMPRIPPPFVQRGGGGGGELCHPGAVSAPIQSFHAVLTRLSGPVDPAQLGKDGPRAGLLHAPPHNSPPPASPDGLLLRHHGK